MNASEAKCVAEFLGEPYYAAGLSTHWWVEKPFPPVGTARISDADLLLACLERAAELDMTPYISHDMEWFARLDKRTENPSHPSYFDIEKFTAEGPTPLAAIIAAIVAYMGRET